MSDEVIKLLGTFLGSAVIVKVLDLLVGAYRERRAARAQGETKKLTDNVETKRLTLDEISFVIRSQQEEINRLNLAIGKHTGEIAQRDEEYRRLFREHEELTDKYTGLLRRLRELERELHAERGEDQPPPTASSDVTPRHLLTGGERDRDETEGRGSE